MYTGFTVAFCFILAIFWVMFGILAISNPDRRRDLIGSFKGLLIATTIAFALVVSITIMENMGLKV